MAAPDSSPAGTAPEFDPDAIARQGRFVRALARGLVRDDEAADELTARTLATAVAQRPETGPGFRSWLERVTWRLFRREQRDRERREQRERAAAPAEATSATVDLVAQIDLQQQVARAFESLAEPSKSALFLRYFHDLSPTHIAAQLDLPLGTVKSRLQRGLEQLRERLDAAHRGRRDEWLAALVPWMSIGGTTVVATKSKLAPIAIAAALVAGTGVVVFEMRDATLDDRVAAMPAPARVEESAAASAAPSDEPLKAADVERVPVAVDPAMLPFAAGSVVDAAGAPLAEVVVVASRLTRPRDPTPVGQQSGFDYTAIERDTLARTDSSGRFVIPPSASALDDLVAFWFVKPGFGLGQWWELSSERGANQDLRVVLEPAQPLRGTVRDSEGNPIANARVGIGVILDYLGQSHMTRVARNLPGAPQYLAPPAIGPQHGNADANGRFDLGCVPRGRSNACASADGYGYNALGLETPPDPWNPVLLRSDLLIDVVDVDTQEPIRHASAILLARSTEAVVTMATSTWEGEGESARWSGEHLCVTLGYAEWGTVTNQRGFLEMQRPPWLTSAPGETLDVELRVVADGYRADFVDVTLSTKQEPPHLRVELVPDDGEPGEAAIAGRVVGVPDVTAAATTAVRLYLMAGGWDASTLMRAPPLLSTKLAADGAFAFHELPKGRYLLLAHAKGCAPATLEVDAPCSGVQLELRSAAALEVTVVDCAGRPVKSAVVHVQDGAGKEARTRATDADGRARFRGLPEGPMRAIAFIIPDGEGYARSERASPMNQGCFAPGDVVEACAGETAHLEIALLELKPVSLHFEHDDGTPVTRVALEWHGMDAESPGGAVGTEWERLRGLQVTLDSCGDGLVDLYPGRYHFQATETTVRRRITIDVPRTGVASATIQLPNVGPSGTIRGRLVDFCLGTPIFHRDVIAIARPAEGKLLDLGTQTTDRDGRFLFTDIPVGPVELWIEAGLQGGRKGSTMDDPISPYGRATRRCVVEPERETTVEIALPPVKALARNATLKLATFPLEAFVTDAATGAPIAGATVEFVALLGDTELFAGSSTTGADGRARGDVFAAEKYRVSVETPWLFDGGKPIAPKFRGKSHDLTPKDGVLTVDVALAKRE